MKGLKCVQCDWAKPLKSKSIQTPYSVGGLDHFILNGVFYAKCPQCGEEYFGYGNLEQLHGLIAEILINKESLLKGNELNFLIKYLGFSGKFFADLIGYRPETISRAIRGKKPISKILNVVIGEMVRNRAKFKLPNLEYNFHDYWLKQKKKVSLKKTSRGNWKLAA